MVKLNIEIQIDGLDARAIVQRIHGVADNIHQHGTPVRSLSRTLFDTAGYIVGFVWESTTDEPPSLVDTNKEPT